MPLQYELRLAFKLQGSNNYDIILQYSQVQSLFTISVPVSGYNSGPGHYTLAFNYNYGILIHEFGNIYYFQSKMGSQYLQSILLYHFIDFEVVDKAWRRRYFQLHNLDFYQKRVSSSHIMKI
jgi:hypothetical protein